MLCQNRRYQVFELVIELEFVAISVTFPPKKIHRDDETAHDEIPRRGLFNFYYTYPRWHPFITSIVVWASGDVLLLFEVINITGI